jgi:hypothetical protein
MAGVLIFGLGCSSRSGQPSTTPVEPPGTVVRMGGVSGDVTPPTPLAPPLTPCQQASATVLERARQTLADAAMDSNTTQKVVGMLDRVVIERCTDDQWSDVAIACYVETSIELDPFEACAASLTEEQTKALTAQVSDEQAVIIRGIRNSK